MITATGYSKDQSIMPEGIAITFGREMVADQGGIREFLKGWFECMEEENGVWKHYCKNTPQRDIAYVYIIILNRLAYRVNFMNYEQAKPDELRYKANGDFQPIVKPGILMCGPVVKCPVKRKLSGFQGFRYTTKLF